MEAEGKNLLHVCLSLGLNLPYFCWHPALHSVGACRQCAVKLYKDEADTRGRIVMSCMTPVTDGMRISIEDPEARTFRGQVTEWLMVNHPHDCPICDEGGECHLQDMVVMTGHAYRRYRFTKRTHRNQDLGPFLNHEMNRCIQCYRCIRFYRDYAGGRDLEALGAHDDVYFGRQDRRGAGERVQRQPRGGLPHGRVHRQDAEDALHAQVGPADRAVDLRALRAWAATRSPASATARCGGCAPGTTAR